MRSGGASESALRLVVSAATPALRRATFGGDDELDDAGLRAAATLAEADGSRPVLGRRADAWMCAPSRAATQTARAAGCRAQVDAALADCAYGRWSGRSLDEVIAVEPQAVQRWWGDPSAAPPGGESFVEVSARVAGWLAGRAAAGGRTVAFTHAVVVRAAVLHALGLPPAAMLRLDVAPLSVTRLRCRSGRWTLYLPPVA